MPGFGNATERVAAVAAGLRMANDASASEVTSIGVVDVAPAQSSSATEGDRGKVPPKPYGADDKDKQEGAVAAQGREGKPANSAGARSREPNGRFLVQGESEKPAEGAGNESAPPTVGGPPAAEAAASAGESASGYAVPYERFRQVNGRAKAAEAENARLHAELREWQNQQAQEAQREPRRQESLVEQYFGNPEREDADRKPDLHDSRIEALEVHFARQELRQEIVQVRRQFPKVPERVLREAVVADGNADLATIAKLYTDYHQHIADEAIAAYHAENARRIPPASAKTMATSAKPAAPPRVAGAPSVTSAAAQADGRGERPAGVSAWTWASQGVAASLKRRRG